jgi:nucleoside-triphosphatase THEP1
MAACTIILTGDRGVGKSTVCQRTVELAKAEAHTCGGIITLRRAGGALEVLDVQTGDVRPLTVRPDVNPAVVQGRYRFDPQTLAWGNTVLRHATPCHLLVIDELGPLEMDQGKGWTVAFDKLRRGKFTLAIAVVRPERVVQAQIHLPSSATTVLAVTEDNRDELPGTILQVLESEVSEDANA